MSDQGLSAEPENTPAVAGPAGTGEADQPTQAEVDWQKRYTDLQPEYTRASQEAAELRQQKELYDLLLSSEDPDTRREAAEALGYALEEQQPDPDLEEDPWALDRARLDQLEARLSQADETEFNRQQAAQMEAVVDERLDQLGIDREDQDWVLAYAINALPATPEGLPDLEQAYTAFQGREDARQKAWAKTKRAPHIAANGQAATEVPNLDDRQQRWEYMTRRLNETEQAS